MKILKLTFQNLNSYEGKVEIDFTDPWFQKGNNQFVICGPMGAGKSTILDAITLALYGSTARLGRLTKREEAFELINKRCGYCSAEVLYSCSKGVFVSVFELHRAHYKVDGSIQPPECALYSAEDTERKSNLLNGQTTDALQEGTKGNIKLTYDQFIRCILIPQGEFDKFLTSDEREKAGILAKLSHTEHYKKAAKELNDKASELKLSYDALKKERDAITVLSEEERAASEQERGRLTEKVSEQDRKLRELTEKINWIGQLKDAEQKLADAKNDLDTVQAGQGEYRQKTEELRIAEKAADCDMEYQNLQSCISEQEKVFALRENAEKELQNSLFVKEEAEMISQKNTEEYEQKKIEKESKKELWSNVRALDTKITVAQSTREEKKKSFDQAKKNLEDKKKKYTIYENRIKECIVQTKELTEYLEVHQRDEKLGERLVAFTEKNKAWKKAEEQKKQAILEGNEYQKKQEQLQKEKETLVGEKERITEELHSLVSSKYMLVAEILRQDLKPGCSCPVCGKEYSSDQALTHMHIETTENDRNETAMNISALKDALESKETEIQEKESALLGIGKDIETSHRTATEAEQVIEALLSDINELLSAWDICMNADTSEAERKKTEQDLMLRKDHYLEQKESYDRTEKECSELKIAMEGINLKELQEICEQTDSEFKAADQEYTESLSRRSELFGETTVDAAEKAFDEELLKKETARNDAGKKLQDIKDDIHRKETEIKGYQIREEELKEKRIQLERAFSEKIEKNQFASEEEFLNSRKDRTYRNELEKLIRQYEERKTATETAYQIAQKAQENLRAENKTEEKPEDLNEQKEKLNLLKSENDQKIGALKEKLEQDAKNQKAWAEADAKLLELGDEAEIYSRISDMLGKKDGSDFEVFVQGIAMRSLLEKANVYLMGIIPKYRLVQKAENSVEFIVHETREDLTVVKRELSNFSGGEKFIISLSLALAMAEFAGQNGDVECIFLDEGFGTLSGEPLNEAINALKRLSTTGKMLGIITHMEAVIQAFQNIEAVKHGEKSILVGPGVRCSEAEKKRKKKE